MSIRQEVDAMNSRFHAAFNKRDAAGLVADYAEDCLWMFGSKDPVRGRAAIQKAYADAIAGGLKLKSLETVHAEMDGNLGYCISKYDGSEGPGISLSVVKRDKKGNLAICAEAIVAGT
jgi:ketosteroid isomerase-like protein